MIFTLGKEAVQQRPNVDCSMASSAPTFVLYDSYIPSFVKPTGICISSVLGIYCPKVLNIPSMKCLMAVFRPELGDFLLSLSRLEVDRPNVPTATRLRNA